jgi:16S rRNA (adenine1518-N6/adenine1519-N6)-dimethyltransferase
VSAGSPSGGPEGRPSPTGSSALTSPRVVRDVLERHGLAADRSLGQHFLVDERVLASVVEACGVGEEDEVWEVGPGLGVLTRELARIARRVVGIELDARMVRVLAETVGHEGAVRIVHADATTFDFGEASPGAVFAANLPYNVGTAVLVRVLESGRFRRVGVLLQREVAQRLCAPPGSRTYGSLSLLVAHHGVARIVRTVSPGCFVPPPAVTSAVVRIDLRPDARPDGRTFSVVRTGFAHRRKTLARNLRMAGLPDDVVAGALEALGLDPKVRAEALDLATFRALADRLPPIGTDDAAGEAILEATRVRGSAPQE